MAFRCGSVLVLLGVILAFAALPAGAVQCVSSTGCALDPATGIWSLSSYKTATEQIVGIVDADERTWLYGNFSVKVKFPYGNTNGIAVAFYLIDKNTVSNKDPNHCEIDTEIYGGSNSSALFYTTNIFTGGQQNLYQLHFPWDGASSWHTYEIIWNPSVITWRVDGYAFRILSRTDGHPWPSSPMILRASVWDASSFSAQPADYSLGPKTIQFRDFGISACPYDQPVVLPGTCPTWRGTDLPWNVPPTAEDAQIVAGLKTRYLAGAWGWDLA